MTQKERALRTWLRERDVKPAGPATYAYYNAPFVPGFLKRNEVVFDVAGD